MKKKIIFSIVFSLVLGVGSILFIWRSNKHTDQKIYKDFYIITGEKTKFPFEMVVDKGTTYEEAWSLLEPINTSTPIHLYRKAYHGGARSVWEEVKGNEKIIHDTAIKADYK